MGDHHHHPAPFPAIPPAPADFASPIPLGPMVAVQSLFGFSGEGGAQSGAATICWDPVVGMFRGTGTAAAAAAVAGAVAGGATVFEQVQAGEGAHVA